MKKNCSMGQLVLCRRVLHKRAPRCKGCFCVANGGAYGAFLKRISTMELLTPGTLVLCRHTAQAPSAGQELL